MASAFLVILGNDGLPIVDRQYIKAQGQFASMGLTGCCRAG
jgi:hypothetical protein